MSRCAEQLDCSLGDSTWTERIAELRASGCWRALLSEARGRFESLNGLGLKMVATGLGFTWRDDDPGGANSMAWYEQATQAPDAETQSRNRRRLLEYNEDDVRATLFLRDWLSTHSSADLPVLPEEGYAVRTAAD